VVPPEVLTTIEEKRKKVAAKNATALAESKKRKGWGLQGCCQEIEGFYV
jgi:hypothetical protein